MYYQNGSYMQDLNYYNQNPNYGYNPYPNNYQSQNMGMNPGMQMPQQNLNAMYPAVHRIISPVVAQVLANNNTGYLTEDSLNSMVDTVYNIVERDVNVSESSNSSSQNSCSGTENSSVNNSARAGSNNSSANAHSTMASCSNRHNSLLRDLIRIMILNEILSRRQNQSMMMQNANMNTPRFL